MIHPENESESNGFVNPPNELSCPEFCPCYHQTSYHIEMSGISVNNGRLERDQSVGIYPLVQVSGNGDAISQATNGLP